MACSRSNGFIAFLAAASMTVSSTGAVAATPAPAPQQISSWTALAVLSGGAPAAALCGAAAVAAAAPGCVLPAVDAAPVVAVEPAPAPAMAQPPPVVQGFNPLIPLALAAVFAGALIYILTRNHGRGRFSFPQPSNSPA